MPSCLHVLVNRAGGKSTANFGEQRTIAFYVKQSKETESKEGNTKGKCVTLLTD